MDQAPSSPTKTLSSTPTAWVTIAAAIALEAAMTRNGSGGAQRSMHKAHDRKHHERRDLLVVFLKFACPDAVEIEQIVQEINQRACGRPQRAWRHARRQCGDCDRGKDHTRKSRERRRFRIGQQHAEKGQAATLRIVIMIPDVVRRKAVIFQDFKIVIEIVRVIIAAAAGKKSAPQQQPRRRRQ